MNPADDVAAAHAGRLAATTTWYGAYLALCAIPDQDLEAVAEALEADLGPGVDSFLARAAQANAGLRAATFLAVEDQDPDYPALRELLDNAKDRVEAGEGEALDPAVRLVAECADLGVHLSGRTARSALALAVRVYQWRRDRELFQLGLALAKVIAADADQLCARLDLTASLHQLRYQGRGNRRDLDEAIALGAEALTHAPASSPARAVCLANQATRLELRYEATGRRPDLDEAIAVGADALTHAPASGPARAVCLAGQATRLSLRYEAGGRRPDLDDAIAAGAEALIDAPAQGPARAVHLSNQSNRLQQRYEADGRRPDLDEAVAVGAEALTHAPASGPDRALYLAGQANLLQLRYQTGGQRPDLDDAIAAGAEALTHAPASGPDRAGRLANQATRLALRYHADGRRPDLDDAIVRGAEALTHAPPSGPTRAGRLANQATRLALRYQADGRRPDLDEAIALGADALTHAPPSGPDRAAALSNQATRLRLRYQADRRRPDLDEAIALGADALFHGPASGPDRAMYLSNQANRFQLRFEADRRRPDRDEAVALGAEALIHAPPSAPDRAGYLSYQANRLQQRYQADGDRGDLVALAWLAREWSEIAAGHAGTRDGVIGTARGWMARLCRLADEGVWSWAEVAATGGAVLARAAQYATLPEGGPSSTDVDRDNHALSVRAAVDGVVGVTALAWVRAGDARSAVQALEDGAATVARDQASRIPWDLAAQRTPEIASAALDLQARILHAATTGAADGLAQLHADYAQAVEGLRESLGLPTVVAARVGELARRASGPLVWVVATSEGGLALRLGLDGHVHHLELAALDTEASRDWHHRLHPRTDDDGGPSRPQPLARAPRGHGIPDAAQVDQVGAELDAALGEAAAWLGEPGTVLVPLGLLGGLPWQVTRPALRLHVTATQATAPTAPAPPGTFVVYADAEDNLPGAREEATALADNHRARPMVGPQATLAALAAEAGCRLLHLALHGTDDPEPALVLADQALHLGNVHRLRHLWAALELVVLNCCTSAATLQGVRDETLGLATIALTGGTRAALVALWPVQDQAAAAFATAFHNARTHHLDPHRALAHAREATPDPATAAAYQLLG